MPASPRSVLVRVPALASTAGFAALTVVLAATGALAAADAAVAAASVALGFAPSGWLAPIGWRRRAAEATLVPAACALMLLPDLAIRRMLLPPLLATAAVTALLVALQRAPRRWHPLLAGCCGLAVRAAGGLGLTGASPLAVVATVAASFLIPWAASHWGREVGVGAALVSGALPLARWPGVALVATVVAVWLYPWGRSSGWHRRAVLGWLPAVAAGGVIALAASPWGGLPVHWMLPGAGLAAVVAVLLAAVATTRLPPAAAGVVWLAVAMALGPAQGPSPDRRAGRLTADQPEAALPEGTGDPYIVDIGLWGAQDLARGVPVSELEVAGQTLVLRVGDGAVDVLRHVQDAQKGARPELPGRTVWRPARIGSDGRWRASARTVVDVAEGERPVLRRLEELPQRVRINVEAAGPSVPTPPRDWTFPAWLWATALVVLLVQLASGSWRLPIGLVPWCLLATGQVVARSWVEPLRLVGERYGVDLCLAALLAAWLPAAWMWLRRAQPLRAAAALLVPLALATPHLTPPLYGDEPFHLLVMQSLVEDHDLDLADNLDLEHHPDNRTYVLGAPLLHSPVLAILLLPGYLAAGRSGALLLMALAGAGVAALIARRMRQLGVPGPRAALAVMLLTVTYPLATFSTQIWAEVPGALAVAVLLAVAPGVRSGAWLGAAVALVATAIKTRLALLTFPPAALLWLRGGRRRPALGLAVVLVAALLGLAVGWITMGHPFGYFRRLRDLLPTEPRLAVRVVGGLLFDHAGGLAFAAPLLLVAVACLPLVWRRAGGGERALLAGAALTVLALLSSQEWYGGGSPPARYLVPLLPVLGIAWGVALRTPLGWRRAAEVLVAPSLLVWWALVTRPHFSVNPGDGGWWLADALARRFDADSQQFFPSFLVPTTATVLFPLAVVLIAGAVVWAGASSRSTTRLLVRGGLACWLAAAAALALAVSTRCDRVVEVEGPQVRHRGGRPVPPEGTFSRFTYRNGWRVANGESVTVPLKLPQRASVVLEGWVVGPAQRGTELALRWDDGRTVSVTVRGEVKDGRLRLPDPPGGGRHRLSIVARCPPRGAAVLDRIVVER